MAKKGVGEDKLTALLLAKIPIKQEKSAKQPVAKKQAAPGGPALRA